MATYLQGVTDYIPQFQPFQPDLNFYANVLQTKQTQYDNNWKALNNMYSKFYYSELVRDKNIQTRDAFIKDAQFNLKKISQLDLSLEQNVKQATQVFRPFYENKDLMKDMAWTKNRNAELAGAESLRNSMDPKINSQYWDEGVQEIMYKTDEFKNASDEEALAFANVKYTPNVDIMGRALDIAKDFGDVQSVDFSNKRWVIKTRNGEQLEEPLEKLFQARLGNDPSVQAYFRTKAYLERKNYVEANAAQFNGDKSAAEMNYLQGKFNAMKVQNQVAYKQMQEQNVVYDNRIQDIKSQIEAGNKDPRLQKQLDQYLMNKDINDQVLKRVKEENDLFNSKQGGDPSNPYGDIKSFRYKVDSGLASSLMQKSFGEAAHVYAFRNYLQDADPNPYQVNQEKYEQNAALMQQRFRNEKTLAEYKAGLKQKLDDRNYKLEAGTHMLNEKGELVEKFDQNHFFTEILDTGTTTPGKVNLRSENEFVQQKYTQNYAVPYFNTMMRVLTEATDPNTGKKITQQQINYIINGDENKYADLNRWASKIQSSPNTFLADKVGVGWMNAINYRFKNFVTQNSELTSIKNVQNELATSTTKFDDYLLYLGESKKFEKDLTAGVESELTKQGFKYAKYLYDENGNIRSKEAFLRALPKGANLEADKKTSGTPLYVSTGSSLTMGTSGDTYVSMPKNYYENLTGAASKIVASPETVNKITKRKTVPGLEKLSDGTGLFSKAQFTVVNPRSSFGTYHYSQVLNNIRSQDLGASNITLSVGGIGQTGAKNKISDETTRAILTELQRSMDAAPKNFTFKMGVAPIALNNASKSAYIFQLPPELIDKLTGTLDSDGNLKSGILRPSQAKALQENGLSIIMDRKNFNSDMYNSIFTDPLAAYVDRDNTYSWADPVDPRYKMNISGSPIGGDGSYKMDYSLPVFDNEKNSWVVADFSTIVDNAKSNLSDLRDNVIADFNATKQINNQRVNGY